MFDKFKKTIQNPINSLPKTNRYYSDVYPVYSEIFYDGLHTSLRNKSQTYTVEGVNLDLRYYITSLRCRSRLCSHDRNDIIENMKITKEML